MTLTALAEIGSGLGLSFTKNHNKRERARMILDAYNAQDLEQPSHVPPSLSEPPALGEPKPGFEALIDDAAAFSSEPLDSGSHGRGGIRPGAGRPPGMTAEISAYNRLSLQPHPTIKSLVEKLFDKWAESAQCPEIRLTKDEAVALALPWTHAYELSPIGGKIPPWLSVAIMCAWSTWSIVDSKAALAREAAQKRQAESRIPPEILN